MSEPENSVIGESNNQNRPKKSYSHLDVLKILIDESKKEFTLKEIQDKLSISYEPAYRYMQELLEKKYVTQRVSAHNQRFFSLNPNNMKLLQDLGNIKNPKQPFFNLIQPPKKESKLLIYALLVIVLLAAFSPFYVPGLMTITGMFSGHEYKYSESLQVTFDSQEYDYSWNMQNYNANTTLSSVMLSGYTIGDGNVTIYLEDNSGNRLLILDTTELTPTEKSLITGFAINKQKQITEISTTTEQTTSVSEPTPEPMPVETPSQPITETATENATQGTSEQIVYKSFSFLCDETCLMNNYELNQSSYKLYFNTTGNVSVTLTEIDYSLIELDEITNETVVNETIVNETVIENITLSNYAITDAKGSIVSARMVFTPKHQAGTVGIASIQSFEIASEEGTNETIPTGTYDVTVELEEGPITEIAIHDINISENQTSFIKVDDTPESNGSVETYAIDPTEINFTSADVTVIAKGDTLQKCKDWNFENQSCNGTWVTLQSITPGQQYTFELTPEDPGFQEIIVITNAMHLDENKTFVSDIYEQVRQQDDVWSETVSENQYVRITFEIPLTSERDITIYPRTVNGTPRIEIYEVNGSELIAEFTSIDDNEYNKVYITNLEGEQDTFDLKIIGGSVEFDHIVDPATGAPSSTLAFFMTDSALGSDKGIDDGVFDESPIQLNDYGNVTEKCELWDCTAWTGGPTTTQSYACTGGWNCTTWNGVTCGAYTCQGWTASGVNRRMTYCGGGWDCTNWNGDYCRNWNCTGNVISATTNDLEYYCSGGWDCTNWSGNSCDRWNCTAWTSIAGKVDRYCSGVWDCTNWSGNSCDRWNCTAWTTGTTQYDYYPSSGWNCTTWAGTSGGICDKWEGISWTNTADAEDDYYCDRWSCTNWDASKKVCQNWGCLQWLGGGSNDLDYHCTGSINCTTWKSFSYDTTLPNVYFVPPTATNGTSTTNSSTIINSSIIEQNLNEVKFNWNGTNYTVYDDSLTLMLNLNNNSAIGDSSTVAVDVSKYGNNGTLINGVTWNSSGKYAGAAKLNGVNQTINFGSASSSFVSATAATISVWIYPIGATTPGVTNSYDGQGVIGDIVGGYIGIYRTNVTGTGDRIWVYNWDTNKDDIGITYNANEWTHIVLVHNSTTLSAYKNGQFVSSVASGSTGDLTNNLQIGKSYGSYYYNGMIDEVRIWNAVLSASDVQKIYESNLQKVNSTQWYFTANESLPNEGTYTYQVFAKDSSSNANSTDLRYIIMSAADITSPTWSSNQSSVQTPYSPTTPSRFNISWQDGTAVSTVQFESNYSGTPANYTMTNTTYGGAIYNYSAIMPAGTYYWKSWANDTTGNRNVSSTWIFTIAKADNPVTLLLNGSAANLTVTYNQASNASAAATAGTVYLYRDSANVGNPEIAVLGVGVYVYKANATGNTNYSDNTTGIIWNLTVIQATPTCSLSYNPTSGINYGTQTNVSCSCTAGTAQLFRNGTNVTSEKNTNVTLGAGTYGYVCNTTGNTNYTSATNSSNYVVNKADPSGSLTLYLQSALNNATITFGTQSNATGISTVAQDLTFNLYRNGSSTGNPELATFGAGYYVYVYNTTGGANYSSGSTVARYLTVSTATDFVNLTLNGAQNNVTITYGANLNASSSSITGTDQIYRNGSNVTSEKNANVALGAGYYSYKANTTGNANYSANSTGVIYYVTVSQAAPTCALSFNPTSPITFGTQLNASCSCTNGTVAQLYRNGTNVTIEINANATLGAGTYNYTCNTTGNTNYTSATNSSNYVVNKADNPVHLYLNGTLDGNHTYVSPATINATGTTTVGTVYVYRDNALLVSGASPQTNISTLTAGTYSYKVNATGNANYSDNTTGVTFDAIVLNKIQSNCSLSFNPTSSISYGSSVNVSCSCDNPESVGQLYRNGTNVTSEISTNVTLGAGNYEYECNVSETTNYSAGSNTSTFVVSKADPSGYLKLYLQNAENNATVTHPTQTNATGISTVAQDLTFNLYRNGTSVASGSPATQLATLGAGYYVYVYNTTGGANYSSGSAVARYLTVNNKAPDTTTPTIAPTTAYKTNNLYCNATLTDSEQTSLTAYWTWYKNDVANLSGSTGSITNGTNSNITVLLSGNLTKGESWICKVTPYDGYVNGTAANSTAVVIQNTIPTIGAPTVNSTAPYTNDVIACNNGSFSDADSDSATWYYSWYDTGALISGQISSTLDLSVAGLDKTDNITCSIIASDGTSNATAWQNSSNYAIIQNSAPITPTSLTPTNGLYGGTLNQTVPVNCSSSTDADSDTINYTIDAYYSSAWHTLESLGDGAYNWNVSAISSQVIDLRCNSTDGTNQTSYYNPSSNTTIDNTNPTIAFTAPTEVTAHIHSNNWIVANVSITETNLQNFTYYLYNSSGLINSTAFTTYPNKMNWSNLAEGDYSYNTTVYDQVGNFNETGTRTLTINFTMPSITIDSPEAILYDTTSIWFNATTNFNVSVCKYSLDSAANVTMDNDSTVHWYNLSTVSEGEHEAVFYCNFTFDNNYYSNSVNFTVDIAYPSVTFVSPTPANDTITLNDWVYVNITGSEALSAAVLEFNSTNYTMSGSGMNWYYNVTGLAQGSYTYFVYATDNFGKMNVSEIRTVILNRAPDVVIISPLGETYGTEDYVPVVANVLDSDGIDSAIAEITKPDTSKVNITLGFGQQNDSFESDTIGTVWINEPAPIGDSQACVTTINTTVSGKAYTSLSGDGSPETDTFCSIISKKAVDGNFDISIEFNMTNYTAEDIALNFALVEKPTYAYATKSMLIALTDWAGYEKEYEIYVNDDIFSDYLAWNDTGFTYRETDDSYGKFRITRSDDLFTFYTWNNTADSWNEEAVNMNTFDFSKGLYVVFNVESASANFGSIDVAWDNFTVDSEMIAPKMFEIFTDTAATGIYNVSIFANDTLGLMNSSEKSWFNITVINHRPSTPFILTPAPFEIVSDAYNITWSGVVDRENSSVQFNITLLNPDGSDNATIASSYGNLDTNYYEWDTTAHPDGLYSLRVVVYENETVEGYTKSYTLENNFTIDNTPPTIQFVEPTENTSTTVDRSYIQANVTVDDLSLAHITVYLYNSTSLISSSTGTSSPYFVSFTGLSDGVYYINATATDLIGHANSTETRNVTVSITVPPVTPPTEGPSTGGGLLPNITTNVTPIVQPAENITEQFALINLTEHVYYPNGTVVEEPVRKSIFAETLKSTELHYLITNTLDVTLTNVTIIAGFPATNETLQSINYPARVGWNAEWLIGWSIAGNVMDPQLMQWEVQYLGLIDKLLPGQSIEIPLAVTAPLAKNNKTTMVLNVYGNGILIARDTVGVTIKAPQSAVAGDYHNDSGISDVYILVNSPELANSNDIYVEFSINDGKRAVAFDYFGPYSTDSEGKLILAQRYNFGDKIAGKVYDMHIKVYKGLNRISEADGVLDLTQKNLVKGIKPFMIISDLIKQII